MRAIKGGDAQNIIEKLIEEGEKNPQFHYRILLKEDGQLTTLFWCDHMVREDYNIHGDVVIFDITNRTN